jgi:hypothetical protein
VADENDKFVTLAEQVIADVSNALTPGAFLVDQISAREPFRNIYVLTVSHYSSQLSISRHGLQEASSRRRLPL